MTEARKKLLALVLSVLAIFVIGYGVGRENYQLDLSGGRVVFSHQSAPRDQLVDFNLFWQVYDTLQKNYYDKSKLDGTKILYGAIQGMVASLGDPYTSFLTPVQNKEIKSELAGVYEGVGIQLGYKDGRMVVIAPLDGTPAKAAGVKAGDRILKIGDKLTDGLGLPDAVSLIRGAAGTKIDMSFLREGSSTPIVLTLTRAQIQVKSAEYSDKGGGVGYIKLSRFADNTNGEWDQAVSSFISNAGKVLIVDVRDNPGGYLESARYIGAEFIASGPVVKQDTAGVVKELVVNRQGKLLNIQVVILMNKGSASASEIVAGALQDTGRGILIGEQSFGKGTIQEVDDVQCVKKTSAEECPSLHITSAKWLTPKGRWINGTGLTPDIKVALTDDDFKAGRDPQLDRAIEVAKGKI